ncbi:hypothetical protein SDRG_04718 [Saprolegnia diclina VS20]|uniref:Kazal-like domain-containing protein n=1 Tax=Saprolegnia diclina (strain VS20) TaxID=1156394 RepID=T0RYM2_SAPDV|nr:hypothetical protein SDRG_04718 [Saprolegnia diclina VS20]EQC37688.1 hypothetical protein SDRG_04718 [Saprolegnia diclina VS20]|eukprot:XP_008608621.1 hypothetical protein SDRG_04718 [Saprolegnia diclina VS20]
MVRCTLLLALLLSLVAGEPLQAGACGVKACPRLQQPQCGSDGVTYMNACAADKIKCGNRRFTYKAGSCPKPRHPKAADDSDTITFPTAVATPHLRVRPATDRLADD